VERNSHSTYRPEQTASSLRFVLSNRGRRILSIAAVLVFCILFLAHRRTVYSEDGPGAETGEFQSPLLVWQYPLGENTPIPTGDVTPGDLLKNGNMDQLGFYWRPPNHWIAGGWFEWFSTKPFNFPEYGDGFERNFYHTYPSSQRLQLFGSDYAAGLMQSPTVTPCTYYQFQAFGQSRPGSVNPPPVEVNSHMKVGIEPYGWKSGRSIRDGYDPGLEPEDFPATVIWSPEATHNFVFAPYTITAEAQSDKVTVILYAYPEIDIPGGVEWNDTIWDTASLVEVPPPPGTRLDGGNVPEPDGLISNVSARVMPEVAIVQWETSVPASTQLLYRIAEPADPISNTQLLTYSLYLPMVTHAAGPSVLDRYSRPDTAPVLHHQVVLVGLPEIYTIDFVALSRRLTGEACVTSASSVTRAASSGVIHHTYLPVLLEGG
jgi:hypothetical protein